MNTNRVGTLYGNPAIMAEFGITFLKLMDDAGAGRRYIYDLSRDVEPIVVQESRTICGHYVPAGQSIEQAFTPEILNAQVMTI